MTCKRGAWPLPVMIGGPSGSGRRAESPRPWGLACGPRTTSGAAVAAEVTAAVIVTAAQTAAVVAVRRRAFAGLVFIAAPIVSKRATLTVARAAHNRATTLNLASPRGARRHKPKHGNATPSPLDATRTELECPANFRQRRVVSHLDGFDAREPNSGGSASLLPAGARSSARRARFPPFRAPE